MQPTVSLQKVLQFILGQNSSRKILKTSIANYTTTSSRWRFLVLPMFVLALLSGCGERNDHFPQDTGISEMSHTIAFELAQAKDYSGGVYDGAKATLNLTISVENMRDGSNIILWDTVFNLRELREFPAPEAPLFIRKNISRISNADEVLRLSHTIRYFDKNNTTWMAAKGETVPRDQSLLTVGIAL